jgi:hypothetical protein
MFLESQHPNMSRPGRLKCQPTANTTPQPTPSFDAINSDEEVTSQRTGDAEEITRAAERRREKVGENLQKSSDGLNTSASQK